MAHIAKCDSCGALDEVKNRVEQEYDHVSLNSAGLRISIEIPSNYRHDHLCRRCVHGIVSARFGELCGLLAPYQPVRVAGFVQDGQIDEAPLTKSERAALSVLSRRLLKA